MRALQVRWARSASASVPRTVHLHPVRAHRTLHLRRTAGAVQVGAVQVGAGDGPWPLRVHPGAQRRDPRQLLPLPEW